ncbi:FecR domain-containing protein [Alkalimarinus coralli]|uniref:FecR domain-containing protein n=1 Tax=Alkalimarinus coralli TaxID=2935863 RepID=UPI00202B8A75|nr:FecR domain-containing protein [Alkalimarinus coralli]
MQAQGAGSQLSPIEWHYTIRPKDNIWAIGEEFLNSAHSWADIIRHNKIDKPKTLTAGTVLKIPVDWLKHQPEPAMAASVSGRAMLRRHLDSHFSNLTKNSELRVGDEITTYDGSVLIRFADSSILRLASNSNLVFNRLTRYGKTGMADTRMRLQKGRLSTHVTPLNGRGSRYEINTPSAVAAVRGTAFRLATSKGATQLEVTEGAVNFSNNTQSVMLKTGQGTAFQSGMVRPSVVDLPKAPTPKSIITSTQQLPVTFSWLEQQDITTYYYQLYKGSDQGELLDASFLSKPEVTLDHLTNGTYLVAMRAVDRQGFNGLDHQVSVVIGMVAKAATLLQPSNDLLVDNDMPEFTWQYNSKNELSQLELARDFEFTDIISASEYAPDNTALPNNKLLPGEYYWRVKTLAGGDSIAYSDVRRLRVRGMLPPSRIISVSYVDNRAKIFWNSVPQADHYVLQLAEDFEFKNVLYEDTLTKSSASIKLSKGKRYFARVKGVGNELFKSEFSTGKELKIE